MPGEEQREAVLGTRPLAQRPPHIIRRRSEPVRIDAVVDDGDLPLRQIVVTQVPWLAVVRTLIRAL